MASFTSAQDFLVSNGQSKKQEHRYQIVEAIIQYRWMDDVNDTERVLSTVPMGISTFL